MYMEKKEKKIAYKLFRVMSTNKGKLFPLYVNADKPTPIGVWLDAECGELKPNGKVKSKLGDLAFRPGWHLSDYPLATHIGVKGDSGEIEFINAQHVWCECEYSDEINYQEEANKNGTKEDGKFIPRDAFLKKIPENGYYRYKTNPKMFGDWIISGKLKINRILSDKEVNEILTKNNLRIMPRQNGKFNTEKYGFEDIFKGDE